MGSEPKEPVTTRTDASADPSPAAADVATGETVDLRGQKAGRPGPRTEMFGRFRVIDDLGEGGMGVVRLAHDPDLDRKVAIKVLRGTASTEARARLVREAQAMAKLAHPNVVTVFEVGVADDQVFIAMELVDGGTLTRWLSAAKRTRQEIIDMFLAVGAGVAAAHEAGLVHRDFKPDNVLIGADGRPRVSDFGLVTTDGEARGDGARATPMSASLTATGAVMGTPHYMAPEQFVGEPTDARTDQFAFCVALYEALYGERPFAGATLPALAHNVTSGNVRPRRAGADVPDWLRAVLLRGLAVAPAARFGSMGELLDALRADPSVRQRRRRRLAALGATVVLATGGIAIGLSQRGRTGAPEADRAAEAERLGADRKAEDAAIESARSLASTNPALAIARLKPLAGTRWRDVRAIAAQARLAGVAWSLPSAQQPQSLQLSRDGRRAIACGAGGDVLLHDLDARTSSSIATVGARASAVFADDDRRVVVWSERRIDIVQVSTRARTSIEVAASIASLGTAGTAVYWASGNGALWELDLAGTQPQPVQVAEAITRLSPSPDGRWLALAGAKHAWLIDRTRRGDPPLELVAESPRVLDWSRDGARLALLTDASVIEVAMEPQPHVVHREPVGPRTLALATADGVVTAGPTGVDVVSARELKPLSTLADVLDLEESRDGVIVAAERKRIAVYTEYGNRTLAAPGAPLSMVRASPASPYVVAASGDRLFVWNVDDVIGRVLGTGVANAVFAGDDAVIMATNDGPLRRLDLATGDQRDLGTWPPLVGLVAAPSGRVAVAIDARHTAHVFQDGKPPIELARIDQVGLTTDTQIIFATDAGTIEVHDVATAQRTKVHTHRYTQNLVSLATNASWVATGYSDVLIWRMNLADGSEASVVPPSAPTSSIGVSRTGDVFVADGKQLLRWPAGASDLVPHATLDRPIAAIGMLNDDYLVAFSEDGTGYRVALASTNTVVELGIPTGSSGAALSPSAGLLASIERGAIDVTDPLVPAHWRLAGWAYRDARLSPGGRRVLATDGNALFVWRLDPPTNAAETSVWLDRMTNAIAGPQATSVGWR